MAINLYSQMPLESNEFVLASALSSCANLLALKLGKQIHAQSIKLGCSSISFVSNSLISMYMKNDQCGDALSVFARTPNLTDVSYNTIIMGLVESNQREKAFEVYKSMCQQGLVPDRFTFVGLLGTDDLGKGMQLHSQTIKLNLDKTAFIGNIIMIMYSNLNLLDEADKGFRSIKEKDVISWNTLIAACSRCDDHSKALVVFREMVEYYDGRPDEFTYASLLSASAGMGSIQFGRQIHAHLIRTNSSVDIGAVDWMKKLFSLIQHKSSSVPHTTASALLRQMCYACSCKHAVLISVHAGNQEKCIKHVVQLHSGSDISKADSLLLTSSKATFNLYCIKRLVVHKL
ncbi:hypothetical protein K7X08_020848 [Anisodus acutangulus]|uniref:Pentatricopeptide repeat-containing protein n=1 Tax=Anisodus acutangulus TaxID=402998 RepID=A0A9Q1RRJ0_9SOLA|nr:hypothetical protein K7X08_020848 [Anisodus acutangulus]